MEIKLQITKVLPEQTIQSKSSSNVYTKYGFVGVTLDDKVSKNVYFSMFNPEANVDKPRVGDNVVVSFDISSRSFTDKNGVERWSTEVNAWKVQYIFDDGSINNVRQHVGQAQPIQQSQPVQQPIASNDLPF